MTLPLVYIAAGVTTQRLRILLLTQFAFSNADTLFSRLCAACPHAWEAYCRHPFVEAIGDGTLPLECFQHYLQQDYLFLIQFARAYALAVYKADDLEEMCIASQAVGRILNEELSLHLAFCREWGLSDEDLKELVEAKANMAYTRYVLDRGLSGDLLDLYVALIPCTVGYGVIGKRLAKTAATDNPYQAWIETYAADNYQEAAEGAIAHLEKLAHKRETPQRFDNLAKTFREATMLEVGFWEMGQKVLF